MKKRLTSLLLISLMLLLCFTACAEKTGQEVMEDIGKKASQDAISLSIYLMSEQPVSSKQELLMEEKLNDITENGNNIHIDLKFYTEDEYYTQLEKNLARMEDYYGSGSAGKDKGTPVYTDENGLPAVYYPPLKEFDVDIFYFSGYERYAKYKSLGYLTDITEDLNGSAKALKATVNNKLIEQFNAVNGAYDAIPTNRAIGEYTFMLLNKDILTSTKYKKEQITSLVCEGAQDILQMVSTDSAYADYVPLYSSTGEIDVLDVKYFNTTAAGLAQNTFSVLGGTYDTAWSYGKLDSYPAMNSVLNSVDNGHYTVDQQINILKGYDINGYYATEADADKTFAIGYVKGGPEVIAQYGDEYEVIPVALPTLENDDLYEHLFAVSGQTNSISGSTEILTLINTNEEVRNLLLYGVEGENYTWRDSDVLDKNGNPYRVVERQTKDPERLYFMDANKTGNVSITYTEKGNDPLANEYLFIQNADLVIDYALGFSFYDGLKSKSIDQVSFNALLAISESSNEIYAKIKAAKTQPELDAAMNELKTLAESDNFKTVMAVEDDATSPYAYYLWWLESKGLVPSTTPDEY